MKENHIVFFALLSVNVLLAQTEPVKSLHRHPPRTWALTNATVHTEPGKSIINGTITVSYTHLRAHET